jgi:acyl carrier protein
VCRSRRAHAEHELARGRAEPSPEHTLSDLGITSLRLVALIADLEDDLGIPFEHISWLRPHSTVASLLAACSAAF